MANWKGFERKLSWLNLKKLSQHSPGGIEENHEKRSIWIAGLPAESHVQK
jgi:hypothetical protein